jgi:L-amino acid N-acyltransferase YncA
MIDFPLVQVVPLQVGHWAQVRDIYAAGIATGHATFEPEPPSWAAFEANKLPAHRLVALDSSGTVLGWAAASAVSDRCVYAGVVEHSVYVDPAVQSCGIGRALLAGLATSTEAGAIWTIQSGIFPENAASLRLHHKAGFRIVGTRQRVGKMTYGPLAGQWRDVIMIERRSIITGRD